MSFPTFSFCDIPFSILCLSYITVGTPLLGCPQTCPPDNNQISVKRNALHRTRAWCLRCCMVDNSINRNFGSCLRSGGKYADFAAKGFSPGQKYGIMIPNNEIFPILDWEICVWKHYPLFGAACGRSRRPCAWGCISVEALMHDYQIMQYLRVEDRSSKYRSIFELDQ